MGRTKLTNTFLSYTITQKTSEATPYLADNIKILEKPKRAWRSANLNQQELELDLGSSVNEPEIYFDYCNVTNINILGRSSSGGANQFGPLALTVERDEKHGVYRLAKVLTGFNKRYLVIQVPAQTPVDNAAYYQIGTVAIPTNLQTVASDPWYPLTMQEPSNTERL